MIKALFIDGPQLVGKSTLLEGLKKKFKLKDYKFPFSKYSKELGFSNRLELNGYQIGKDLSSLYWINSLSGKKPILVDRGPFSSAYYSRALGRSDYEGIYKFLSLVSGFGNDFKYLFITAKNQPKGLERNKNDGFDTLRNSEHLGTDEILLDLRVIANKLGIKLIHFENDFSLPIEENLSKLYKLVEGEL